jgi:sarcosine oxidase subunit gamma
MSKASVNQSSNAFLQSPLHGFELGARVRPATASDGVLAAELPHLGYIVLRGHGTDTVFMQRVAKVLGTSLSTHPAHWQPAACGAVLWQSPDEWMVVCRRSARDALVSALNAAVAGLHAQVVDVSGGLTTVRLAGCEHVRLLRHLGPYDFDHLGIGRSVGTVLSKASVTVLRTDDAGVLMVFRRSFADYVWRLIELAAQPYGLAIVKPQHHPDPVFTPLLENMQ